MVLLQKELGLSLPKYRNNYFQFRIYSNTLRSKGSWIDILWVCMLLTGVNMTQLQKVWNTGGTPKPSWKNKGKTWHTESKSINLCQNTSGFDSTVLNPEVKDSMQQSSKYFHCSSVSVRDNCKGEGKKILTQYLSCVPFPPDSLFFNVFLLLWGALGDGWVEESSRWYVSATSTVQSLTHFPCLQSQAMAIIQSPTNSAVLFFFLLRHFNCRWLVVFLLHCSWNCFPGKLGKSNSWRDVTSWTLSLVSHTHKQPRRRSDTHSPSHPFSFFLLAHTHKILRISHRLLVKLNGTQHCLNRPWAAASHMHWLLPFKAGDFWSYHVRHASLMMAPGLPIAHKS